MPKAGTYEYPSRDLDDCLSYLRRAREGNASRVITRQGFADAIGQSTKGGGFGKLVGAMADYGLVETGRGTIRTTELCEQILYGNSEDQRKGRDKSVRAVRLFNEVIEQLGGQPTHEQLGVFLKEKGGVDFSDVDKVSVEIGKLVRKNSVHAMGLRSGRGRVKGQSPQISLGDLVGRVETRDYGILNIRDEISMNLAISLLDQVKKNKGWGHLGTSARATTPPGPPEEVRVPEIPSSRGGSNQTGGSRASKSVGKETSRKPNQTGLAARGAGLSPGPEASS